MSRQAIAYYRVSTMQQGRSGLGLEAQRASVKEYIARCGDLQLTGEYQEIESGKRTDRPELDKALALCRERTAVLIIAKLDRLARNVWFVENIRRSGVEFVAADMPFANKLTVQIMCVMAEAERDLISQRTKDALKAAKARGIKLGGARRPAAATRNKTDELRPIIAALERDGIITIRGIRDALNSRNIQSTQGGKWHIDGTYRLMRRIRREGENHTADATLAEE